MSCIERAGWFSGLLSAVKLYQSVSISGPSATSKPIEPKIASMRSMVRDIGCSAAGAALAAGQRHVERLGAQLRFELGVGQRLAARRQQRFDLLLGGVDLRRRAFSFLRPTSRRAP